MIRHIVLLRLPRAHDAAELQEVMRGLDDLRHEVEGLEAFEHGQNLDFENKLPDHPYGFVATFTSAEAVKAYAENETHRALGERLVALCGGAAGIMVIDLDV